MRSRWTGSFSSRRLRDESSGSKFVTTLILVTIAGIVLQGLLAEVAPILPWLVIGLVAAAGIAIALRVFFSRSKHF